MENQNHQNTEYNLCLNKPLRILIHPVAEIKFDLEAGKRFKEIVKQGREDLK